MIMNDYKNVKVKVFGSRKELKTYDLQDEQQVVTSIRDQVLPTIGIDYHSVKVKVKRKSDQSPEYMVAYMLRKDTYTADIVKIEINGNYQVKNIVRNYDDSVVGEDEEDEDSTYGEALGYAVDFVVSTPVPEIESAKAAVEEIHKLAISVGMTSQKLLGPAASVANYKNYLKLGLKGFVNIGHGNTNCIVLDDGILNANWFNSLIGTPLKPAVVYFNSCQVFNSPLQPAVMKSGARTFIGGIVNLGIGTSEEVCKCFWDKSFKLLKGMGANLNECEKEKYPRQGDHGISGDTGIFWQSKWHNNQKIIRTHAKCNTKMAWALLQDSSWIPIAPQTTDGVTNVFMIMNEGLANNHNVDVYIRNSQIEQATLR
jgi:hypothetical protein